jgi:hypothetical protein
MTTRPIAFATSHSPRNRSTTSIFTFWGKQEGAIKYKTFVGWAKQRVPIIREMGTAFEAFAHPTFNHNYLLKYFWVKTFGWKIAPW